MAHNHHIVLLHDYNSNDDDDEDEDEDDDQYNDEYDNDYDDEYGTKDEDIENYHSDSSKHLGKLDNTDEHDDGSG
ncbi:MAG: hypothetical protein BYD32DRAFT_458228 [Podila humilis]|nr:MAG: hypothetical protein BYD32DRAFT_458228 [Podila humilis]